MNTKKILKYTLLLIAGVLLLNYTYKGFEFSHFVEALQQCNLYWIFLAIFSHLMNHFFRAWRWQILMEKEGKSPKLSSVYLAEMSGFFINSLGARLGEWVRCNGLKKLERTSMKKSLAAVVVERSIDMLFFCVMLLGGLLFDFGTAKEIFIAMQEQIFKVASLEEVSTQTSLLKWFIGGLCTLGILFVGWRFRHLYDSICKELIEFWNAMKTSCQVGSMRIFLMTVWVWLTYFLLEYIILFAIPATSSLGLLEALFLFVALNISVVIPLPGSGIGVYHLVVSLILKIFGIPPEPAFIYATITHSIQLFNAVVIGGGCALTIVLSKRK